jgi:hypothetical protein
MDVKEVINRTVNTLQALPDKLSGEDSAFANPWEEIKDQIKNELNPYWPVYRDTIKQIIRHEISSLNNEEKQNIAYELKLPIDDIEKIVFVILKRIIVKARMEKMRYTPYDFEYFTYKIEGMNVYARVIKRTGINTCEVMAYSVAAPSGENGNIDIDCIDEIIDEKDFIKAKSRGWE